MHPEAQRIAIAEACGLKGIHVCKEPGYYFEVLFSTAGKPVPNYLNDLNAMHEAEKCAAENLMNADQWEEFGRQLEKRHPSACLKATDGTIDYYDFATLATDLTATQRAEAFLRTLDLWKDET